MFIFRSSRFDYTHSSCSSCAALSGVFFFSSANVTLLCSVTKVSYFLTLLGGFGDYHQPSIALRNIVILRLRRLIGLRGCGQWCRPGQMPCTWK